MQDRPSSAALETPRAGRSPLPLPDSAASSRRPLRPDDFPDWATYYWTYQYELASTQLHPCLEDWGVWRAGVRILDVGCGDGGGTCALAEAGARIAALDILVTFIYTFIYCHIAHTLLYHETVSERK